MSFLVDTGRSFGNVENDLENSCRRDWTQTHAIRRALQKHSKVQVFLQTYTAREGEQKNISSAVWFPFIFNFTCIICVCIYTEHSHVSLPKETYYILHPRNMDDRVSKKQKVSLFYYRVLVLVLSWNVSRRKCFPLQSTSSRRQIIDA